MIDLKSLRSIAEEHGAELMISPHQTEPVIVMSIKKDNAVVSCEVDAYWFGQTGHTGVQVAEMALRGIIEKLEAFLTERAGGATAGEKWKGRTICLE